MSSKNNSVITMMVGGGGNRIGQEFWKAISQEHLIDPSGKSLTEDESVKQVGRRDIFYRKLQSGGWTPRCLLVDFDDEVIDSIRSNSHGKLFDPSSMIYKNRPTGNNWAKGHYTYGSDLCEPALDQLRREVEKCDNFRSIQYFHTIGGGTGSGLGTLLMSKFLDENGWSQETFSHTIFPSITNGMDNILGGYNATLSIHQLVENCCGVNCFDNNALQRLWVLNNHKNEQEEYKSFENLNSLVTEFTTCMTSTLRFPGPNGDSFLKMLTNLIPFPRLHFFMTGIAPISFDSWNNPSLSDYPVSKIVDQLFDPLNWMCTGNTSSFSDPGMTKREMRRSKRQRWMTAALVFRGNDLRAPYIDREASAYVNRDLIPTLSDGEKKELGLVLDPSKKKKKKKIGRKPGRMTRFGVRRNQTRGDSKCKYNRKEEFTDWIDGNINNYVSSPNYGNDSSSVKNRKRKGRCGCILGNNKEIQGLLKNVSENFTMLFRKRAFLHMYMAEGMDEMEFVEAESNLNDLISEFQEYASAVFLGEDSDDDE